MSSFFRRQWLKRCGQALSRQRTAPPVKPGRRPTRPVVEELEVRCVPAPVGPGKFTQDFTSNTEFNSTTGVYEIAASVKVDPGVTLKVDPGVTVQIDQGDTLTVNGVLTLGTGATVQVVDGSGSQFEGITVDGGSLTATNASFVRQLLVNDTDNSSLQVIDGGSITATGSEFQLGSVTFAPDTVLSSSGASNVTGNSFDTVLTVPAVDLTLLTNNVSFSQIDFAAGDQVPADQTVFLGPLGTGGGAAPLYVFTGAFSVAQSSTLAVSGSTTVLIDQGDTVTVNGTLAVAGGATVEVAVGSDGGSTGITVDGGVLEASGASFDSQTNPGVKDPSSLQVLDGGQLYLAGSQFSWDQLTLAATSTDSVFSNTFASELAVDSGASVNVALNDFSSPSTTVVASGATGTFINLAQNYWGTTDTSAIEAKITDSHTNSALPTVTFSPPLASAPSSVATVALVQDNVVTYSTTATPVTLSALLNSTGGTVNEGTMTFVVLDPDGNMVGQPVTGAVSGGAATADYSLPANASAVSYQVLAIYSGGPDFQGSVSVFPDSGVIAVKPAATSTSASSTKVSYSEAGQTLTLNATVTSAVGTVNQGMVEFFVRDSKENVVGSQLSGGAVANGSASATYSLPAGTAAGSYSIEAAYVPTSPSNLLGSSSSGAQNGNLTISPAATTTTATGGVTPFSESTQTVTLTATVTSPAGTVNEGAVAFTVVNSQNVQVGSELSGGTVANGSASVTYTLPAGTPAGSYTVVATYSDSSPGNFQGGTTSGASNGTLSIRTAATTTTATGGVTPFSESTQTVTLTATVTSPAGTVNEGTVAFVVLNSQNVQVGSQLSGGAVSNGSASATYSLPAGATAGSYTVAATFTDVANGSLQGSSSSGAGNGTLAIGQAATTTTAANASATSELAQSITLTAAVTSSVGPVNEGSVSFAVFNSQNVQVGSQLSGGTVTNGSASATYTLPSLPIGSYTIRARFTDSSPGDFSGSQDASHSLLVQAATVTAAAPVAAVNYSESSTSLSLSATVTSPGVTVGEGTVTFTLLNSANIPVGTPVTSGTVTDGSATAMYTVPAGTPAGTYTVQATYNDGTNGLFQTSSDSTQKLTIQPAGTTTSAAAASTSFSQTSQTVSLSATVTSPAGTVGEGTVTFDVFNGSTMIGSAVTSNTVTGGSAGVTYTLPAGLAPGAYSVVAHFTDASPGNLLGSDNTGSAATLTVTQASTTVVVGNEPLTGATNQTITLQAVVSSAGGAVSGGTVSFTILQGNTQIGQPVSSGTILNGNASVMFTLPAGLAAGKYTIQAAYSGSTDFSANTGDGILAVNVPPSLPPINGGNPITLPHNQFPDTLPLGASSPIDLPLSYTTSITGDNPLYDLEQQYAFTGVGYATAGAPAYVLHSNVSGPGVGGYYLLSTAGGLYAYDGSGSYSHTFNNVTPLAQLGSSFYTDPTQLLNSQPPVDYTTLYNLEQQYQFTGVGLLTVGASAYVLHSNQSGPGVGGYYLINSGGSLYAYDGSPTYAITFAKGTPLAQLGATVYSNPNDLLEADATPSLYVTLNQLNRQYDLEELGGSFYTNTYGHNAEWLYSPVLNQFGQHWYTLTLQTVNDAQQAVLTAWEGYQDSEVGAVVATLDPSVYSNPAELADASAPPTPAVTATVDGSGNLTITLPNSGNYAGTFKLTVAVTDGLLTVSRSVMVTSTDAAPTIGVSSGSTPIPQGGTQTIPHLSSQTDTLTIADADGDTVTTSAAVSGYSQAFSLQQLYQFKGLGYIADNGTTAYVLQAAYNNAYGNPYYLMNTAGGVYAYDGSGSYSHTFSNVTPVATLGANYYADPTLLTNAQPAVNYTALYNLMQQYQFTGVGTITAGATAYVLHSSQSGPGVGGYYLLSPAGGLYAYDGSGSYAHSFTGTPLATVDPGVFANPSLLLNARANPAYYDEFNQLEQQYDLQEMGGSFYTGLMGNAAKWLYSPVANVDGQHWYTLVPAANGTQALLYAWDGGTNSVPTGAQPLAVLDNSAYVDPTLLINAKAPQAPTGVTATVSGGVLTLSAPSSFVGTFQVTLTASDGVESTVQTFQVNSTDTPPVPDNISATAASQSGAPLQLTLGATAGPGSTVAYSAQAVGYSAAYNLQQLYHFTGVGSVTVGGVTAYVLQSSVLGGSGGYYLLSSTGGVYAYDGSGSFAHTFANSANLITTLDPSVYNTPALLTNAQAPTAPAAVVSVSGDTLTVNVSGVPVGTVFQVIVTATDGAETIRTGFLVTVTQ